MYIKKFGSSAAMKKKNTPRNTKDNIYKKVFGEPQIFAEFLDAFVPVDLLKNLKPGDIEDACGARPQGRDVPEIHTEIRV